MTRSQATFVGFGAILLWSFLALFAVGATEVPALQLNAMCFSIGGAIGLIWGAKTGGIRTLRTISWKVYAFGATGLFGYHLLYFSALRLAPAAEAGLIAYLWPLLIVLFSGFLPGEQLRRGHIIGGLIAFTGAAVLITGGDAGYDPDNLPGYGLALLCAITWAGYSVLSRRLGAVPTDSVTVFCLLAACMSVGAHFLLETTVWPSNALAWAAVIALGTGPVGLAFFIWDIGVKRGDIQLLGVLSYAAPVLSTIVLILAGVAPATFALLVAATLIAGGAALAARASAKN